MPSLRRTASSPMVRASPYPYPTSLATGTGIAAPATRVRRACSGSEPNNARRERIVLADIEWWRVLDGQLPDGNDIENGNENGANDTDVDQDQDRQLDAEVEFAVATAIDAVGGMMHQAEWDATNMDVSNGEQGPLSITTPFAALSISSVLPMTPQRRRAGLNREASDASDVSSIESSPESSPNGASFADALASMGSVEGAFGFGLDMHISGPALNESEIRRSRADLFSSALLPDAFDMGRRPSSLGAAFMLRSVSFNGFESPRESIDDRFGDVVF